MLNSAVSLGRAGIPVSLLSRIGKDPTGMMIRRFLHTNGVDTTFCASPEGFQTPVALAFIDQEGNASYEFYRPHEPALEWQRLTAFGQGDIILFGSWFALNPATRGAVSEAVKLSRKAGARVLYDPNFRRPHRAALGSLMGTILENLQLADIIRGSDEDFLTIFGAGNMDELYHKINPGKDKLFIMTRGRLNTGIRYGDLSIEVPGIPLTPVSTVGAGDAFNAGVAYGLSAAGKNPDVPIPLDLILELTAYGHRFAAEVCTRQENHISAEFANHLSDAR